MQDGIYVRDFPRLLQGSASIAVGGRADLMVRCQGASSEYRVTWAGNLLATVARSCFAAGISFISELLRG